MIKSGNTASGTSSQQVCLKSVKSQVNRNRIKVLSPVWNQTQIKIPIHEKIIDELYKVWYVVADEKGKS